MSELDGIIVTWESIVGKEFLDVFQKIAIAEYWAGVKELSIKTVHDKFDGEDITKYQEKRSLMRHYGWRQSYLTKAGKLKFFVCYNPKICRYISLSEYIAKRDADRMEGYEEEYYAGQDVVKKVSRGMGNKTYRVRHDDVFVREDAQNA